VSAGRATQSLAARDELRAAALELAREVAGAPVPPAGRGLYAGDAGIGWLLAHVSGATASDLRAPAQARLAAAAGDPGAGVGLADGLAGTAVALVQGGRALGDTHLIASGRALASRVVEQIAVSDGNELPEYLNGLAGAIVALLALADEDSGGVVDVAREAGDQILRQARRTPWGWGWEVPGLTEGPVPPLCGLAHGSAGVALALHELAAATGERRWAEAADEGLRYVWSWYRRAVTGWPDLRLLADHDRGALDQACSSTWCHGGAGIGLAFLRVYQLTGDRHALAGASAALQSTRAAVTGIARQYAAEPAPLDASLCHGLGSLVETFLAAWEILRVDDHLRAARRVAGLALSLARRPGCRLESGDPERRDRHGLFLGQAGIAAWLLRAAEPAAMPSPLLLR
jgi:lantibiotic biosynthesis protein